MRTQSTDTSPEAERVQIELLRKASMAKKFGLVNSLEELGVNYHIGGSVASSLYGIPAGTCGCGA